MCPADISDVLKLLFQPVMVTILTQNNRIKQKMWCPIQCKLLIDITRHKASPFLIPGLFAAPEQPFINNVACEKKQQRETHGMTSYTSVSGLSSQHKWLLTYTCMKDK